MFFCRGWIGVDVVDIVIRGEDLLFLLGFGDICILVEGKGVLVGFCSCGVYLGGSMSIGCNVVKVYG